MYIIALHYPYRHYPLFSSSSFPLVHAIFLLRYTINLVRLMPFKAARDRLVDFEYNWECLLLSVLYCGHEVLSM